MRGNADFYAPFAGVEYVEKDGVYVQVRPVPASEPESLEDGIRLIAVSRPTLDNETNAADFEEWCRVTIVPTLDRLGLL